MTQLQVPKVYCLESRLSVYCSNHLVLLRTHYQPLCMLLGTKLSYAVFLFEKGIKMKIVKGRIVTFTTD